jgi:transcription initiation factor IIF auxiliary subunit
LISQNETKNPDSTTTTKVTIESIYVNIPETPDEKLYRLTKGHEKASYVRRVINSDAYKRLVAQNKKTEKERMKRWRETLRKDSIIKVEQIKKDSIQKVNIKKLSKNSVRDANDRYKKYKDSLKKQYLKKHKNKK